MIVPLAFFVFLSIMLFYVIAELEYAANHLYFAAVTCIDKNNVVWVDCVSLYAETSHKARIGAVEYLYTKYPVAEGYTSHKIILHKHDWMKQ